MISKETQFLPVGNTLSISLMAEINDSVITNQIPADDEKHFAEALCRGLRAIALVNKAKFSVDSQGIKREKVGDAEKEMFEGTGQNPWADFIKTLPDLCSILGFKGVNQGIGIQISPSDKFVIDDQPNLDNLVDLKITGTVDTDLIL